LKKSLISFFIASLYTFSLYGFSPQNIKEMREAIKIEYLKEYPKAAILDVKIQDISNQNAQNLQYKALEMQRQNLQKNSGVVLAVFEDDKNITKKLFVRYDIEALIEVLKAKYNLQKDKILSLEDVEFENVKFKNFYSKPLDKESIGAVATKRFIASGTILTEKDAAKAPAVRKNSVIYAILKQDSLEIELEVTALEDGSVNDTISVRTKSGKTMRAFVVAKDRLEIR
jgi:flagella basal body P-ring formation protein FlgA